MRSPRAQTETLAQLPRGSDRDSGKNDGERGLIRLRPENRDKRQQQERGQRRLDDVVAAAVMERVDVRPGQSIHARPCKSACASRTKLLYGVGRRCESSAVMTKATSLRRTQVATARHYGEGVACGSGSGGWKVEGGKTLGKPVIAPGDALARRFSFYARVGRGRHRHPVLSEWPKLNLAASLA